MNNESNSDYDPDLEFKLNTIELNQDEKEDQKLVIPQASASNSASSSPSSIASDVTYTAETKKEKISPPVAPLRRSLLRDLPNLIGQKKPGRAVEFRDPLHLSIPRNFTLILNKIIF